jgi:pimeloyl-ACP methyl ester carboxylesterase
MTIPATRQSEPRQFCARWLPAGPCRCWPVAALAWLAITTCAAGQQDQTGKKPSLPKEDVSLEAKDGLLMKATYYPGSHGKETVPVILVHGFGGNRQALGSLAELLQSEAGGGCAVIVPDLRGHGDSIHYRGVDRALDADRLPLLEFKKMVQFDMEAVKTFLMGKNNKSQLNIEKLCVVGCEMGALVAANWARVDWNWPPLATGKQGQDVKALVLISPPDSFKGLRMIDALSNRDVKSRLAVLIAVGNGDSKTVKDADKIFDQFKRFHPDPAKIEDRDLEPFAAKTKLQGAKLVLSNEFGLQTAIAKFIESRLAKQALPWKDRPNPLQ